MFVISLILGPIFCMWSSAELERCHKMLAELELRREHPETLLGDASQNIGFLHVRDQFDFGPNLLYVELCRT